MGNVKSFTDYLRNIWEEQKPLAVLFKTDSSYYLYDTGTNKILKCDSLTYDLLEKLFYEDFEPAVGAFLKKNGEDGFVKTVSTLKKSIENQDLFVLYYEVTNAVLLTPEMAVFLFENDFTVYVSLDGPEEIHNNYRKNKTGEGSFEETIIGLKNLVTAYGEYANNKLA